MSPDSSVLNTVLDDLFNYQESPAPPDTSVVTQDFVNYLRSKLQTPYRDVFFGSGVATPSWCVNLETTFQGDYNQWAQGLMAQAVYNAISSTRGSLDYNGIQGAINHLNTSFDGFATDLYIYYVKHTKAQNVSKQQYESKLLNHEWRMTIAAKQASGSWQNPSWEMYGHWVKFSACGATNDDIANVFNALTQQEPKINLSGLTDIAPATWRQYRSWHANAIDSGLLHADRTWATYQTKKSETYCNGGMAAMCRTFTYNVDHQYADDYAGTVPWHHSSGGCCFAAGAYVVMEDDSLRKVEDIRPGDVVRSLHSARSVAFVSKPRRRGRSLYAMNDCGVKFTQTHPLVKYAADRDDSGLLVIRPAVARAHIPTLKALRVECLEPGTEVMGYSEGQFVSMPVNTITEYPGQNDDEVVYDLVLEPDGSMQDHYIVSDGITHFAVCSEIPSLTMFPLATLAFVRMVEAAAPELHESALGRGPSNHYTYTLDAVKRTASSIFDKALARVKLEGALTDASAHTFQIAGAMGLFRANDDYNAITGEAVDAFSAHLIDLLPGAIELGWRLPLGEEQNHDYLAVSVYHIAVHAPYALPAEESCALELLTDSEQTVVQQSASPELFQSPFLRHIASCAYLSGMEHRRLQLSLICGDTVRWSGTLQVPAIFEGTASMERLCLLRDEQGQEMAHVTLELRGISALQRLEELDALEQWNADAKIQFADRFGAAIGNVIAEQLKPPLSADTISS